MKATATRTGLYRLARGICTASLLGLFSGCATSGDSPASSKPQVPAAAVEAEVDVVEPVQGVAPVALSPTELARDALIVDTHIDVPYRLHRSPQDVSVATPRGDFDFPRARAGGLDALFMSIYIPAAVDTAGDAKPLADKLIDDVQELAIGSPDKFRVATCAADLAAIKISGRIALPLGMENGGPIAGDLDNLEHFARRGVRYITLAHSKSNHISDSSYDKDERWQGLSPFGVRLITAMNQRGVMVDVSHVSDRAFWHVVETSTAPVIASHSSLRHFTPGFHRNMSDEMVTALGKQGGVIQINFGSSFLTKAAREWSDGLTAGVLQYKTSQHLDADDPRLSDYRDQYRKANPYPYATLSDVLDHIDRAVELAGIDHVGIGSDYDGVGDSLPIDLKDVSSYPNLVAGLQERGYSTSDIRKVLGGNVVRVWREVEAVASSHGHPPNCAY